MSQSIGINTGNAERDAEQHETLGAFHQTAAGIEAQRLGPGSLVGDEHRARRDREREDREVRGLRGQMPRHATEEQRVGRAVGDGIEERTPRARLAAPPRSNRRGGR